MATELDGRSGDRKTMEYIRVNSIKRWLEGEQPLDISRSIEGYCETTIYKWINLYNEGGWDAVLSTKAPGAKCKLSDTQQQQLKAMIVGKEPSDYDMEYHLWTRQIVGELIKVKFDVELGLTQVGVLLRKLEITPQKPVRQAHEQDPEEVRQWKEETFPKIQAEACESDAEVFFFG